MATTPKFDAELMAEDLALRGWRPIDLARKAQVSDMSVYRFLDGRQQTAPMAKKLARALGRPLRRYFVSSRREKVA